MKLFEKLKTNYQLSNMIVRILFVVGFTFCNWQDLLISVNLVGEGMGLPASATIPTVLLSGIFMGLLLNFCVPFVVNAILNISRIYNVPRHEYVLLAMLFFDIGFFACGVLNLVNLITPVFMVWGSILFPLIVSCGCVIGFYKVTSKLYFNVVTRQLYFRSLAIAYLVTVVVLGVMA